MKFFRRYFCMYAEPSRAAREEKSYVSCYSQWPKYWQRLKVERPYKMAVSSTDDWDKSPSKFCGATWRYSLCRRRAELALALGAGTNTTRNTSLSVGQRGEPVESYWRVKLARLGAERRASSLWQRRAATGASGRRPPSRRPPRALSHK